MNKGLSIVVIGTLVGAAVIAYTGHAETVSIKGKGKFKQIVTLTRNQASGSSIPLNDAVPNGAKEYFTDFVIDNHEATPKVVTLFVGNELSAFFSVSLQGNETKSFHFQTGFELTSGQIVLASVNSGTAIIYVNGFMTK